MPKGPVITDEIKRIIAAVYDAHRDWRAKQVQFAVNERLHGRGPGLSAVQKELTGIRKRDEARTPDLKRLDEPWSLASSSLNPEYELPPEAITIVLEAKRINSRDIKRQLRGDFTERIAYLRREYEKIQTPRAQKQIEQLDEPILPLSVREAKWIARIYYVLKDRVAPEGIYRWARYYAEYEKACDLAGIPCNTSDTDNGLLCGDYGAYMYWCLQFSMSDRSEKEANDIEKEVFGHILEDIELTPLGWTLYELWLNFIIHRAEEWPNLPTKEREDIVMRLRDWVIEQEPVEEFSYPEELLIEVKYVKYFSVSLDKSGH